MEREMNIQKDKINRKTDYYITTTIPYVNGRPHVGHALEFVQADALVRLLRQEGKNVVFQTGTDDNAIKNILAAQQSNVTPKEFVDQNAEKFLKLCEQYSIGYDSFVRTSSQSHIVGVQKFWKRLNSKDLYRKSYQGIYCYGCEVFLQKEDLVDGHCHEHKTKPEETSEENIFFRLSSYQSRISELIENDKIEIYPKSRKKEVLAFISQGLRDISVSRYKSRTEGWGVPVPGEEEQVVYVWIDALINYLSGQGFGSNEEWRDLWSEETQKIHCIGKNVWKFHAIYWPALLLSAGLPLPNKIFIHGFLTENGEKISKSLGGGVNPLELTERFESDSLRFYLLKQFSAYGDGDFSIEDLVQTYNSLLVNGVGNTFSRVLSLCAKTNLKFYPGEFVRKTRENCLSENEGLRIQKLLQEVFEEIAAINSEIAKSKPWEKINNDIDEEVKKELTSWLQRLFIVAKSLQPFLPKTFTGFEKWFFNGSCYKHRHLFERLC